MRAYLAGPMRGRVAYNFPAFDAARDFLRTLGHDPVSPADMDREVGVDGTTEVPPGFVFDALKRDFAAILECDAIAFLPGWESSSGAQAERKVAEAIGLPCYRVDAEHHRFYRESFIGIAGVARSGKDTLARLVAETGGYEVKSFAGPLKALLYGLNPTVHVADDGGHATVQQLVDSFGWDTAKGHEAVRALLQRLEIGRAHV